MTPEPRHYWGGGRGCGSARVISEINKRKQQLGYIYIFFSHTPTFQVLDKPWSQVSPHPPPGSCLDFLRA